jgi:hypothetical protein
MFICIDIKKKVAEKGSAQPSLLLLMQMSFSSSFSTTSVVIVFIKDFSCQSSTA